MIMDMIEVNGAKARIAISHEELLIMNAALNEICNGIAMFEFETRIGANRDRVAALLKEVGALLDQMNLADR
jgi:hypothetical protein